MPQSVPGATRRWPHQLAVVRNGSGPLAQRRTAVAAAAAGPAQRVAELEADLQTAIGNSDFVKAAEVQAQLVPAREELALAETELRLLDEVQATAEQERQAVQAEVQEAQRRGVARAAIDRANHAEEEALEATDAALALMRSHLLAAKAAYLEAINVESGVLQARRQAIDARRALGEWPARHPGPTVTGSCKCQTLADTDHLVRELAKWHP